MTAPLPLSYAPPDPISATRRRLQNRMLGAVAVLFAGILGGFVGRALTPTRYEASGLYRTSFPGGTASAVTLTAFENAQRTHVDSLRTPATLRAIADGLRQQGHKIPAGEAGAAFVGQHLRIKPLSNTTLFEVRFESTSSQLSRDAVNDVMSVATRTTVNGTTPARIFSPPFASPRRNPIGVIVGAFVGVLAVAVVLFLLWARARRRAEGDLQPALAAR